MVPPIATSNTVFAVVPVTLTLKLRVSAPLDPVLALYDTAPVAALLAGSTNVAESEVVVWAPWQLPA